MEIVQDIVETHQAQTTTGPYQSPNGAGSIISGIARGLGEFVDSKAREASSGSKKADMSGLYEYMSSMRDIYNSKSMEESEARVFQDKVYNTAYKAFGASASDVNDVASQIGFKYVVDRANEAMKRDAAVKTRTDALTYNAGLAVVGPGSSLDSTMAAGADVLAGLSADDDKLKRLGSLTPSEQTEAIKRATFKDLGSSSIRQGWLNRYNDPAYNDIPEEAAMMSYKNMKTSELVNAYNVDPVVAKSLVDKSLIADELSIYGDEVLTKNNLQFYRDAAKKAYDTNSEIILKDIESTFINSDWDYNVPGGRTVKMSGAAILTMLGEQGSAGSAGAAKSILQTLNALDLTPQLAQRLKSRYSYKHMKLLFSQDGAALAEVLKDNREASANIGDGRNQALDTLVDEVNSLSNEQRRLSNNYFTPQKKWNESFKKPNGEYLTREAIDAMYGEGSSEEKVDSVRKVLDSLAVESNAATNGSGFYFLDNKGNIKYFGMSGNRFANLVQSATGVGAFLDKLPAESLKDLTNSGRLIESGDVDSRIMRDNIPTIQETVYILSNVFGLDSNYVRELFNNSQIMRTSGGRRAVSLLAMKDMGVTPGSFFDSSFSYNATVDDANRLAEMIDNGNYQAAFGMSENTANTVATAGRAAAFLPAALYSVGENIGQRIASVTPTGLRSVQGSVQLGNPIIPVGALEPNLQESVLRNIPTADVETPISPITIEQLPLKDLAKYVYETNEVDMRKQGDSYTFEFQNSNGRRMMSLPTTEEQLKQAALNKFNSEVLNRAVQIRDTEREGLMSADQRYMNNQLVQELEPNMVPVQRAQQAQGTNPDTPENRRQTNELLREEERQYTERDTSDSPTIRDTVVQPVVINGASIEENKDNSIDVKGKAGDRIEAPVKGTVVWSDRIPKGPYVIQIEDSDGSIVSVSGTGIKSKIALGQTVERGDFLGNAGPSGTVKIEKYPRGFTAGNSKKVKIPL